MKKILVVLALGALMASCQHLTEKLISSYEDGTPELYYIYKGDAENGVRVGEKRYYSNGKKHAEIHFADDEKSPKGKWEFYYPTGKTFAVVNYDKDAKWQFFKDEDGHNAFLENDYDSISTAILSEKNTPVEVHAYIGDSTWVFRFYEDFLQQSVGLMINGKSCGKWQFFYPNGNIQLEAMFIEGVKNGLYNTYRDNGRPIYRGYYINDQRAGVWEFYDQDGNLSGRTDFDKDQAVTSVLQ